MKVFYSDRGGCDCDNACDNEDDDFDFDDFEDEEDDEDEDF